MKKIIRFFKLHGDEIILTIIALAVIIGIAVPLFIMIARMLWECALA